MKAPVFRTALVLVLALVVMSVAVRRQRLAEGSGWPELRTIQHVAGRPATWDDVHAERAAISFVYDNRHRGTPMAEVEVPQYALLKRPGGKGRAVLIQAERDMDGSPIYGVLDLDSRSHLACRPSEVILLGHSASE
ncbi:MAG: hypothetical protein IT580_07845 [Verrucomicrobiales bacterium]|nr:hypothetical protein [Verrucomicrobiales bacterium]